jgi:hypothetical protein
VGGGTESCTFPLLVGERGIHVELSWEHDLGGEGVDLDLHLHRPQNTLPWSISGAPQDCTWSNCTVPAFLPQQQQAPDWFSGAAPPDPVDWYLDPVLTQNVCYFLGTAWQGGGKGCHNPRLDSDNITCDPLVTDVDGMGFCMPEAVSVDFPPQDEWTRIGVHYYWAQDLLYDVHPRVKVFCDGALAADLGARGHYDPESPVTFSPADGGNVGGNRFWMVADVIAQDAGCGARCTVRPLWSDNLTKTPLFVTDSAAEASFGPPYDPVP